MTWPGCDSSGAPSTKARRGCWPWSEGANHWQIQHGTRRTFEATRTPLLLLYVRLSPASSPCTP
jgi:hypothetical protein